MIKKIIKLFLAMIMVFTSVFLYATRKNVSASEIRELIVDDYNIGTDINQLQYNGNWRSANDNTTCYENTEHYSAYLHDQWDEVLPSVTMTFFGNKIELYGKKISGHGMYNIYIDGEFIEKVDAYADEVMHQAKIFESASLTNSEHTIKVEPAREKNELSSNDDIQIDFFKVFSVKDEIKEIKIDSEDFSLVAGLTKKLSVNNALTGEKLENVEWYSSNESIAFVDEKGVVLGNKNGKCIITATVNGITDSVEVEITGNEISDYVSYIDNVIEGNGLFEFEYKQTWGQDRGYPELFFDGTNHYSTKAQYGNEPAQAIFRFRGEKVEIYGNLQDDNCIYDIYLDNQKVGSFDAYSKNRVTQQLIFETDILEDKEHEVEIKTTNNKNSESTRDNYAISIDYAKVYHGEMLPVSIDSIDEITIEEGKQKSITASVLPHYATNKKINWKSNDSKIADVTSEGIVTALKEGNTTLELNVTGTDIRKVINVTVLDSDYIVRSSFASSNEHHLQSNYDAITSLYDNKESDFGWRGDRISAKIVSYTKNDAVTDLDITASDFKNSNGDIFSNKNIQINHLKETEAYTGRGMGINAGGNAERSPKIMVPDIIYSGDAVSLDSETVLSSWISIDIPKDTKPGVYNGKFIVTANELETPIELNYSFEVIDLLQPNVDDYQKGVELWEYPYAVAKYYNISDEDLYNEKHLSLLKQNLDEYRLMGGNTITTAVIDYPWDRNNPYDYPSTIKWIRKTDGTFEYDFTHFDKWIQVNLDAGIDDKLKCFSMSPYHAMRYFDEATGEYIEETTNGSRVEVGSDRWKEMWSQFLDAFVKHLDEKGWFDFTYMATDEVGEAHIKEIYDLVQQFPNKDGKTLKISAAVNYGHMTQETLDKINDISINIGYIQHGSDQQKEINEDRRAKGLYTSFYTCTGDYPNSFALSDPGESAWTMWYTATHDMDGYLRWSFDNWIREPYKSLLHHSWEAGDTMLIYPDDNKDAENPQFKSTPRWEKMKEGKRDIEKLYYLEKEYPELKASIDDLLDSLGRRYGSVNAYGGKYASSQDDKDYIKSEVNRMREGLKEISYNAVNSTNEKSTVSVVLNDDKAGKIIGEGTYRNGTTVTVEAVANEGYEFKNWTIDKKVVSTEKIYTFVIENDLILTANFIKKDINKAALKIAIDKANEITDKDLENVVPVVVDEFKAALQEANDVYANTSATQEEVNNAFDRLANAMQKLEFFKGDKTDLQAFVNKVSNLEQSKYSETSWQAFEATLNNANDVLANENALEAEVNEAYDSLVRAFLDLRLIPNKDLLNDLINKAEGLDAANYSADSFKAMQDALASAKAVAANENATQAEVDNAKDVLAKAIAGLRSADNTPATDNKVPSVNNGDTTSVKTGDDNLISLLTGLSLLSVVGISLLRKKD